MNSPIWGRVSQILRLGYGSYKEKGGGEGPSQPFPTLKNSQPRRGDGSGEVGMVSQVLADFEFRSLPLGKKPEVEKVKNRSGNLNSRGITFHR